MPLSYQSITNPSSTTFTVSFEFLNLADIKAVGKLNSASTWTDIPVTFASTSGNGVTTVTVADAGTYSSDGAIRIYRASTQDPLVDFQNGSRLSESDLDTAYRQGLFAAQEVRENAGENITTVGPQGAAGADGADGAAGTDATINNNADNRVITGSGTANTLEGEANLTFNGSTLTAIGDDGTTGLSPSGTYDNIVIDDNGSSGISFLGSTSANQQIRFDDSGGNRGVISYNHNGDALTFGTAGGDRMRIDSGGSVFFNCTSLGDTHAYFHKTTNDRTVLHLGGSSSDERTVAQFHNSNGNVGYINTSGSSTLFVTSSDYRLKENEVAIPDGIERLKQLKPYRFNFKADADTTVDGFFAHEVSSIVPEAISGTKDGAEMQGIDQSKLVPLLTSALQEAITKIETLEAKVTALEANA